MNIKGYNPCDYPRVAQLFAWLATDCWCCSGARAILAFLLPGLAVGWLLPSWGWLGAVLWFAAIVGLVALVVIVVMDPGEEKPK